MVDSLHRNLPTIVVVGNDASITFCFIIVVFFAFSKRIFFKRALVVSDITFVFVCIKR